LKGCRCTGTATFKRRVGVCEFIFKSSFYITIGTVPREGERFSYCEWNILGLDNIQLISKVSADYYFGYGSSFFFFIFQTKLRVWKVDLFP
jgi:hypothetical protein